MWIPNRFSLPIFGLCLGCIIAEISLRILGIGYGSAPLESDAILHHVHPRNYVFVVHAPSGEYGGHLVRYDEDGCVVNPQGSVSKETVGDVYRIALLGDSFVEAEQVPYPDSFLGILSNATQKGVVIKNYGCSSYSPLLYYLQWKTLVSQYRPTHVFLLLSSNDISDDERYFRLAKFNAHGDEPVAVPGPGNDWLTKLLRKSYLVRFLRRVGLQLDWALQKRSPGSQVSIGSYIEETPDISGLSSEYVMKLYETVRRSGATLTLVVVPSRYQLQGADFKAPTFSDQWKAWAKRRSIPFIDLTEPFQHAATTGMPLFFTKDIHWNSHGHRIVAQTIRTAYPQLFRQE